MRYQCQTCRIRRVRELLLRRRSQKIQAPWIDVYDAKKAPPNWKPTLESAFCDAGSDCSLGMKNSQGVCVCLVNTENASPFPYEEAGMPEQDEQYVLLDQAYHQGFHDGRRQAHSGLPHPGQITVTSKVLGVKDESCYRAHSGKIMCYLGPHHSSKAPHFYQGTPNLGECIQWVKTNICFSTHWGQMCHNRCVKRRSIRNASLGDVFIHDNRLPFLIFRPYSLDYQYDKIMNPQLHDDDPDYIFNSQYTRNIASEPVQQVFGAYGAKTMGGGGKWDIPMHSKIDPNDAIARSVFRKISVQRLKEMHGTGLDKAPLDTHIKVVSDYLRGKQSEEHARKHLQFVVDYDKGATKGGDVQVILSKLRDQQRKFDSDMMKKEGPFRKDHELTELGLKKEQDFVWEDKDMDQEAEDNLIVKHVAHQLKKSPDEVASLAPARKEPLDAIRAHLDKPLDIKTKHRAVKFLQFKAEMHGMSLTKDRAQLILSRLATKNFAPTKCVSCGYRSIAPNDIFCRQCGLPVVEDVPDELQP